MTPAFGIANTAVTRYRAIRRIPLEVSSDDLRREILHAAEGAHRKGEFEPPPAWWTGDCEYLLRIRGRGPDIFLVVRKDEATGQPLIVTAHSYEDMARFERRQASGDGARREHEEHADRAQVPPASPTMAGGSISDRAIPTLDPAAPIFDIDGDRLQLLIESGLREGPRLDFKECLPGDSEAERREFTADVCSFANTTGGDLIFGVAERRDEDGRPTGEGCIVGLPGFNFDRVRLRLESIIRTGIEPRLAVQFHEIQCLHGPPCLLVRVPRAWDGLHMVRVANVNRFYGRTAGGRYLLDVREIARGFASRASAREQAAAFRRERIVRIASGDTPVPLSDERKLIVHAVPFGTDEQMWPQLMAKGTNVAATMREAIVAPMCASYSSFGSGDLFNLDGCVTYTSVSGEAHAAYAQLFRHGAIEVVLVAAVDRRNTRGRPAFSGSQVERYTIAAMREVLKLWRAVDIAGPAALGLTLTGLRGFGMALDQESSALPKTLLSHDPFVLPEMVVNDLDGEPEQLLRPLFDLFWNAGGLPRSPNYDAAGSWRPK